MLLHNKIVALITILLLFTGCNNDDKDPVVDDKKSPITEFQHSAVVLTASYSISASDIEIINLSSDTLTATNNFSPVGKTDFSLDAYGEFYFKIGRKDIDSVSKYSIGDPLDYVFKDFSTKDDIDDETTNPYQLVFVNDKKAYLIRWDNSTIWIVNPSATNESEFKIGEINLDAYAKDVGISSPHASSGVIVDGKLFVTLQRLNGYTPSNTAFVAVIDTETDMEIDLNLDTDSKMKGIPLKGRNPSSIHYQEDAGLFVQSIGSYYGDVQPGGIEKINLDDYSTTMIVKDGRVDGESYNQINALALIDDELGYFVSYKEWQVTTLYRFNPSTGEDVTSAANGNGLSDVDIRFIDVGPEGRLWVGVADIASPYIKLIDPIDDGTLSTIKTQLNPIDIVFVEKPKD